MAQRASFATSEERPVDFFSMLPHLVLELDLESRTLHIYWYFKKLAGEEGEIWQTTEQIAKKCRVSKTLVVKAKKELAYLGLISIINSGSAHRHYIQLTDIWQSNHDHYTGLAFQSRERQIVAVPESGVGGTTGVPRGGTDPLLRKNTPRKEEPLKNILLSGVDESLLLLPGWDIPPEGTAHWASRFANLYPTFDANDVEACRDYHGDTIEERMTGRWKLRLRQWMLHKRPGKEATSATRTGVSGDNHGKPLSEQDKRDRFGVGKPLH